MGGIANAPPVLLGREPINSTRFEISISLVEPDPLLVEDLDDLILAIPSNDPLEAPHAVIAPSALPKDGIETEEAILLGVGDPSRAMTLGSKSAVAWIPGGSRNLPSLQRRKMEWKVRFPSLGSPPTLTQ